MPVVTFVAIDNHAWSADFSYMRTLTCATHTDARYLTKNAFQRSIIPVRSCPCPHGPFLLVILHNGSDDVNAL